MDHGDLRVCRKPYEVCACLKCELKREWETDRDFPERYLRWCGWSRERRGSRV